MNDAINLLVGLVAWSFAQSVRSTREWMRCPRVYREMMQIATAARDLVGCAPISADPPVDRLGYDFDAFSRNGSPP